MVQIRYNPIVMIGSGIVGTSAYALFGASSELGSFVHGVLVTFSLLLGTAVVSSFIISRFLKRII